VAYIRLKYIWTPLALINVKLYRDIDTKVWYIRKGRNMRFKKMRWMYKRWR